MTGAPKLQAVCSQPIRAQRPNSKLCALSQSGTVTGAPKLQAVCSQPIRAQRPNSKLCALSQSGTVTGAPKLQAVCSQPIRAQHSSCRKHRDRCAQLQAVQLLAFSIPRCRLNSKLLPAARGLPSQVWHRKALDFCSTYYSAHLLLGGIMMPKTRFSMQRSRRMDGGVYLRPLEYQMLLKCLQLPLL